MNVGEALSQAVKQFESSEINSNHWADHKVDAEYLLAHVLNKNFTWLKTWPGEQLSVEQIQMFDDLVARRSSGEPIAYITGKKGFWSLTLKTNPSTLIPRPESELLVEKGLEFLQPFAQARVLDLGTGTGAIGLAIASERKLDDIICCDRIPEAVALAKENAILNKIENVQLLISDWFSKIELPDDSKNEGFQLIVSNPPYVAKDDQHLNQGDLIFEPQSALVAEEDGYSDIREIIEESKNYLKLNGALMLEHGFEQAEKIQSMFCEQGYTKVKTFKDLNGQPRITQGILIHPESGLFS